MATPKRRYPILEKRRYYLDVLRIVAICAIVLLHVAGSYWYQLSVYTSEWQAINLYDCITRWGVPVFVMISGALFLDPAREQPIKKTLDQEHTKARSADLVLGSSLCARL